METFELKGREQIEIPPRRGWPVQHVGIALTNEEAQEFIAKNYRVFGDEEGPYLVTRFRRDRDYSLIYLDWKVDVVVRPIEWRFENQTGIICWLESIT